MQKRKCFNLSVSLLKCCIMRQVQQKMWDASAAVKSSAHLHRITIQK